MLKILILIARGIDLAILFIASAGCLSACDNPPDAVMHAWPNGGQVMLG